VRGATGTTLMVLVNEVSALKISLSRRLKTLSCAVSLEGPMYYEYEADASTRTKPGTDTVLSGSTSREVAPNTPAPSPSPTGHSYLVHNDNACSGVLTSRFPVRPGVTVVVVVTVVSGSANSSTTGSPNTPAAQTLRG